jgi:hypothetical protein
MAIRDPSAFDFNFNFFFFSFNFYLLTSTRGLVRTYSATTCDLLDDFS